MTPAVKLMDLIDSLEMVPEESHAWLDLQTGRVVIVEDDVIRMAEEAATDTIPTRLPDWQKDEFTTARAISAGDPRYLPLPDKFDFHEYHHMERFIGTVPKTYTNTSPDPLKELTNEAVGIDGMKVDREMFRERFATQAQEAAARHPALRDAGVYQSLKAVGPEGLKPLLTYIQANVSLDDLVRVA